MNQKEIEVMSEALRARGLTWGQTNFAVALARNAIDAAINAMPPDPELERLHGENLMLRNALKQAVKRQGFTPAELSVARELIVGAQLYDLQAIGPIMQEPKP